MVASVERTGGGTWAGSGATPNFSNSGAFTTDGPDREIVIICFSGRENSVTDFQRVTAISASGLTFTNKLSQDFAWTDTAADPSFPIGSMHLDIFTAPAPAQLTSLSWTSTVSGDGFVNNGVCFVFVIAGADVIAPLDTNASNFSFADNLSGTASADSVSGFSTDSSDVLLLMAMLHHKKGGGFPVDPVAPSGWTLAGPIVSISSGAATFISGGVAYKDLTQQSGATLTGGASSEYWGAAVMALQAQNTNPTKTQMVVIT